MKTEGENPTLETLRLGLPTLWKVILGIGATIVAMDYYNEKQLTPRLSNIEEKITTNTDAVDLFEQRVVAIEFLINDKFKALIEEHNKDNRELYEWRAKMEHDLLSIGTSERRVIEKFHLQLNELKNDLNDLKVFVSKEGKMSMVEIYPRPQLPGWDEVIKRDIRINPAKLEPLRPNNPKTKFPSILDKYKGYND